MYVCGPTVYNYIHIGNAVQQLIMTWYVDILNIKAIRLITYLILLMYDKLNRSKELNESVPEIADRYIKAFYEDVGALMLKERHLIHE